MFGYIAPVLSVLTEEQRQRYRSAYCGLCHSLGRYGRLEQVTLSNDMTFLALLLSSLYEQSTVTRLSRCPVHPFSRHPWRQSSMIDYAADMNLVLFYYKSQDAWDDDRSLRGKAGMKVLQGPMEQLRSRYPRQTAAVAAALEALWQAEKQPDFSPDLLCNLSGDMLSAIFVPDDADHWAPTLAGLGEGLGRFIYWMDAWEDYDEDRRKRRFNPLTLYHDRPDYETFCQETLEMLIAEAAEYFELLPLEQDLDLMRNVLYSGAWQRYTLLGQKRLKKEGKPNEQ